MEFAVWFLSAIGAHMWESVVTRQGCPAEFAIKMTWRWAPGVGWAGTFEGTGDLLDYFVETH